MHPQLYSKNYLKHLLSIEGLPKQIIWRILKLADNYVSNGLPSLNSLHGITVSNLFFENSTRTKSAFELAAQKLGAHVISLNIAYSSTAKGESLIDTVNTICAMQTNILVMRHAESGTPFSLINNIPNDIHIINAGDGQHEHPTQALLDMYTILKHKCLGENIDDFSNLRVAIVGDILHSRVARSNIFALSTLGCTDIRLISPKTLVPKNIHNLGVTVYHDMKKGLENIDVIIMLRLQNERMQSGFIPSKEQYFKDYGLDKNKLSYAKPDAVVMHPGPMNRGVEITDDIADGKQSLILKQVHYGIAVRMAVMQILIQDHKNYENSN